MEEPIKKDESTSTAEDTVRHTIRIEPDSETTSSAGIMLINDPRQYHRAYADGFHAGILAVIGMVAAFCLIRVLLHYGD